ncbi:MAG: anthrone oxygenase family protein [Dyadobacter sp.]|uniref:anthrone oxygenase family protein n=1 Tax=Dyadobacter sp. TaxID=1914288 RepID=UPI00326600B6
MNALNIVLLITGLTSALIAGLFYSYSCSVNPGLGQLSDIHYLSAMQAINKAIINPIFFLSFMGTLFLLPVSTYMHYGSAHSSRFYFLLAATIIYVVGAFGVTMMGNVPLNDALEKFNIAGASAQELAAQRLQFEKPWNNLHFVRTVASVLSLVLVLIGCLQTVAPAKSMD